MRLCLIATLRRASAGNRVTLRNRLPRQDNRLTQQYHRGERVSILQYATARKLILRRLRSDATLSDFGHAHTLRAARLCGRGARRVGPLLTGGAAATRLLFNL